MEILDIRDWQAIKGLCDALEGELGAELTASMRCWCGEEERPYPLRNWHVRFAAVDGKPIGVLGSYQEPLEPNDHGWIGWLGVTPENQRKGYGRQMIAYAERVLSSQGVSRIFVHTPDDNTKGKAFYEALGYKFERLFSETNLEQRSADENSIILAKDMFVLRQCRR